MLKVSYEDLYDIRRIKAMYQLIRLNTKNKAKLAKFELFYTSNIINIYNVLKNEKYKHGKYNIFLVQEPKYRLIMSEVMADKIINHIISVYVLAKVIYPKLINTNVATRPGMGTKIGIYYTKKYINKLKMNNDNIYVLKLDIKKYFYNIDHEILLKKLNKLIKDEKIFNIIKEIVNSTDEEYVNKNIEKVIINEINYYKDLNISDKDIKINELMNIPKYKKGKGLTIGSLSSQILAIYYLNDIDHYIKEKLHCKYYVRYMDDMIIFDVDKEHLKEIKNKVEDKLKDIKLELNDKTNIYNLKHGFNFLGYRFILNNKRLIIKINNKTKKRIIKKLKHNNNPQVKASYKGYLKVSNCKGIFYLVQNNLK